MGALLGIAQRTVEVIYGDFKQRFSTRKLIPVNVKTLGDHLLLQRIKADLSQPELGKMLGVSTRTVRKWEHGEVCPTEEHWQKLITILGNGKSLGHRRFRWRGPSRPENLREEETRLNAELVSLQVNDEVSGASMSEIVKDIMKLSELLEDVTRLYKSAESPEKEEITRLTFSELSISGNTLKYKCKNGFQALASRFDPYCAQKRWLSELLPYREYIKLSLQDLESLIQKSAQNN